MFKSGVGSNATEKIKQKTTGVKRERYEKHRLSPRDTGAVVSPRWAWLQLATCPALASLTPVPSAQSAAGASGEGRGCCLWNHGVKAVGRVWMEDFQGARRMSLTLCSCFKRTEYTWYHVLKKAHVLFIRKDKKVAPRMADGVTIATFSPCPTHPVVSTAQERALMTLWSFFSAYFKRKSSKKFWG